MNNELKKELIKKCHPLESIQEDGMDILATFRFKEFGELTNFLERVDLKHYANLCSLLTKKNNEISALKALPAPAVGGMRELRRWVIDERNMAHINCLEAEENALNSVINHIDGILRNSESHDLEYWEKRAKHFEEEFDAANKEVIYLQSKIKETASPAVAVKDDWKERLIKKREEDFNAASISTSKVEFDLLMKNVDAIDRVLKLF